MQYTTNYQLKKPDYSDRADVADLNSNTDAIDSKLKEIEDALDDVPEAAPIQSISVNNSPLTPDAEKNVNIAVPETVGDLNDAAAYATKTWTEQQVSGLNIPHNVSDLSDAASYATKVYVGEQIAQIDIPDSVSDLSDSADYALKTYVTSQISQLNIPDEVSDLTDAGDYALKSWVTAQIGQIQGLTIEVVQSLPATGDAGTLYLMSSSDPTAGDVYKEYIYVNGGYELIGTMSDLTVTSLTTAEIQNICQ